MKRKLWAILVCCLCILALNGCQLAQPNTGVDAPEDRLAGVFLTMEYLDLFDLEGYMNDNLRGFTGGTVMVDADSPAYQGRLYAELTETTLTDEVTGEPFTMMDYVFPIDGIPYFTARVPATDTRSGYSTSVSDPAITDGHINYQSGDTTDSVTLNGTIYVTPSNITHTYYFNPVYQSADGSVYAVSGSGFMVSTESYSEGAVYSQTMDATTTITENGKAKTNSVTVTLALDVMFTPEKYTVLQMDAQSNVLSSAQYAPDAMPESITADPQAEYFIVETHKRNDRDEPVISRMIYDRDAKNIETFLIRENGICEKQWAQLIWPEIQ